MVYHRGQRLDHFYSSNDPQNFLKFAKSSHFADDTCLTYSKKIPKPLKKKHHDLKNLIQWLRANRLSLNVDKTKLLIFKSKYNKNQYQDMITKLLRKRLYFSQIPWYSY